MKEHDWEFISSKNPDKHGKFVCKVCGAFVVGSTHSNNWSIARLAEFDCDEFMMRQALE